MSVEPAEMRKMYEELTELLVRRGLQLGLGRALTEAEAIIDPIVSVRMDAMIDMILGVERSVS